MLKAVVGGLLAAAAVIVPAAANAQDGGDGWRGRHGGQSRAEVRANGGEQRGDWQRSSPAARANVEAQAQAQVAAPQQQPRGDYRGGGGWQGRQAQAGVMNGGAQFDPRVRAQAEAGRPDRQAYGGGRPDRAQWQGGWQGNRASGVFNGQAQAAADARARADYGRRDGDRRWDGNRGGNDRRWDGNRGGDWNGRSIGGGYDRARTDWRDGRRDDRRYDDRRAWNRGWRTDNRYDWNRYRESNRYAYHLPRYYAPYGWNYGYRRFSIGVTLSSLLWAQDYWIDDPYAYRLPEAYGPYRWVRYYNDALLVDTYSGQVVDVIYDIFW